MTLKVALLQMQSTDNLDFNLKQISDLLVRVSNDVELVCLPENCLFLRLGSLMHFFTLEELKPLQALAKKFNKTLLLGSVALHEGPEHFNATVSVDSQKIEIVYKKIHLFDVDVEGETPQRESAHFSAGSHPAVFQFGQFRFGLSICYDVRFAELYLEYSRRNCDVLLVPSAFLVTTGERHWHILLRARAIENQMYVLASAQSGIHSSKNGSRKTFGHSMAVDPQGEIICEAHREGPEVLEVTLKQKDIELCRRAIPMFQHRRL